MSIEIVKDLVKALEPYAKTDKAARKAIKHAKRMLRDSVAFYWWIDDVKGQCESLTNKQCREVLQLCDKTHDANYGMTWEYIDQAIDNLFPDAERNED